MSEEAAGPESVPGGSRAGVDPFAAAMALGGASREEAREFLTNQNALVADQRRMLHLQMEDLREENSLKLSHLRIRRFSDYAKMALEVSVGLLMLALVAGVSLMVWNAAHADGLIVDSFSVPPDLAARGLTGEVVAGQLLDQVRVVMVPPPNSNFVSQGQSISDSWTGNIKVEIPDTGISLGELYRFLRKWFGHETEVGGAVVRRPEGLALTVRVGAASATYSGPEADLDRIVVKAAEYVAETSNPNLYASLLSNLPAPRLAEAQMIFERVINDAEATAYQRARAMNGLSIVYVQNKGNILAGAALLRQARETDPTYTLGYTNGVLRETTIGHPEAALTLIPQALHLLDTQSAYWTARARAQTRAGVQGAKAALAGDFAGQTEIMRAAAAESRAGTNYVGQLTTMALSQAQQHDGSAIAAFKRLPPSIASNGLANRVANALQAEAALEHWPAVVAAEPAAEQTIIRARNDVRDERLLASRLFPWLALAKAKTGDIAGAEAVIRTTPGDCYDCVRVRGKIAREAKAWGQADYWFARAVHDAPSIPFANEDWGRSLLARGKPDEAIAQFDLANQKGPHFADPLEGWGEALMAKNQSHLAVAKFKEADKYAPNWGRLHLKWGEALVYAGKKDEAKSQFARAGQLDLTPSEKSELSNQGVPHA
jgi:Tfp pilus assembly protein PilF